MSSASEMCNVCEKIDFKHWFRNTLAAEPGKPQKERGIELGFLDEIITKTECPFCRLVSKSLPESILSLKNANSQIIVRGQRAVGLLDNVHTWSDHDRLSGYDIDFMDVKERETIPFTGRGRYRLTVTVKGESAFTNPIKIQELGDNIPRDEMQYCGRQVPSEIVDYKLIKKWLADCERYHGKHCSSPSWITTEPMSFCRVIDVDQRRVVTAPANCRYVALSYVWGGKQKVIAQKALFQTDSNGQLYWDFPILSDTIEDAITVTKEMGQKYLWTDAICVIQDDQADKDRQIPYMDSLYGAAVLTIVGVDAPNAYSGLPGVRSGSRNVSQVVEKVGDVPMALTFKSFTQVTDESVWNGRGWTYQERLLSKRAVLFTDTQLFFTCSGAVWNEDLIAEPEEASETFTNKKIEPGPPQRPYALNIATYNLANPSQKEEDILAAYRTVAEEFTVRSVSRAPDKLNAVLGVLAVLTKNRLGPTVAGLPEEWFDFALLWLLRDDGSRTTEEAAAQLPSWCWAGWKKALGAVWDMSTEAGPFRTTISPAVRWHVVDGGGRPVPVKSFAPQDRATGDGDVGGGALEFPDGTRAPDITEAPEFPDSLHARHPAGGFYLYFWTQSAAFAIGESLKWKAEFWEPQTTSPREILDPSGGRVGSILLTDAQRQLCGSEPQAFIFLSYATYFEYHVKEPLKHDRYKYTGEGGGQIWLAVNVMLVRWVGLVAERIGVGRVHIDAWRAEQSGGRWAILG